MTNDMNKKFARAFSDVCAMLELDDGSLGLISPIRQAAFDADIPSDQWEAFFAYCYKRLGVDA